MKKCIAFAQASPAKQPADPAMQVDVDLLFESQKVFCLKNVFCARCACSC